MPSCSSRLHVILPGLLLMFLILGLAACESEHPHRSPSGAMGRDEGVAPVVIPRMEAHGMFFGGQIEAEALLARAGSHWSREGDSGRVASRSGGGGRGGGGFGGHLGGFGGGHGGGRERSYGENRPDEDQPRVSVYASNLPPAALRLRLTNHSGTPVDVEVVDFDSALGNFVVEPPKIILPPGQPVETEPMVSRLGVAAEEIPLTVKLRLNGHSEQQVLILRVVKESAPESVPPAAPSVAPP